MGLEGNGKEHFGEPPETHLLYTAVGGSDASGDYTEAGPADQLAEHVVFGEQGILAEAAEVVEHRPVKEHKHPGREGYSEEPGAPLTEVDEGHGKVRFVVVWGVDVGRDAVQVLAAHRHNRVADECRVLKLNVCIKE